MIGDTVPLVLRAEPVELLKGARASLESATLAR